jgi:hypothetical protein
MSDNDYRGEARAVLAAEDDGADMIVLRATYDCDWWPPGDDEDPVQWGGFCDPNNPWGTAWDDPPGDPTCLHCGEPLHYRHGHHSGCKVRGATGWLVSDRDDIGPWDEPEPDECEHRPEWPAMIGDDLPTEISLPFEEAVEFIVAFPGGVWDLSESEHDQDFRTGVYTAVTLHVSGEAADTALEAAGLIMEARKHAA